ncbi:hypothetical protein ASE36_03450 [Rhizobium sp. Root274]|uniref:inositol monophosphatase family protein n=1 Tax=unclassified Rhizobium TaxID=2613769 RepID=UPI0007155219|nr:MULTISPECIES: inositol monophosphatase [unclassified Rhizobium]KQW31331.1 hypothetical protein ASC71_03450 [Rhizobium sp. Root1240]KRD32875.1 hypothetical protein ASE36_03450 [Rhizobium sp. Root274]
MTIAELNQARDWLRSVISGSRKIFDEASASDVAIHAKGRQDFVTTIDHCLQDYVVGRLSERFPAHQVLAEEGAKLQALAEVAWIIDPLDGTMNFVNSIPLYGISIAMLVDGVVEMATVCDFVHGDIFDAVRNGGARLNGRAISCEPDRRPSDFIAVSTGFLDRLISRSPQSFETLRQSGKIRVLGSQALQLCYVASGRLRANLSVEAKLWDDVAGALVASESGMRYSSPVFDIGKPINIIDPDKHLFSVSAEPELLEQLEDLMSLLY